MSETHSWSGLPPLEALAALAVLTETPSLSGAALLLGVTHGAVSRRIGAVEAWLGVPVVERHGRGVRLTVAGEHAARGAGRALESLAGLAEDARAAQRRRSVRISALPSVARLWLLPHLPLLERGDPLLSVHIDTSHTAVQLGPGTADMALRFGSGRWPNVESILLLEETQFMVAAPALVDDAARGIDPMDFPLISDGDGSDWRAWCRAANLRYAPRAGERHFQDYDMVLECAAAGLGVALARTPLANLHLQRRSLVRVGGPTIAAKRGHHLVLNPQESRPAVLRLRGRLVALAGREDAPSRAVGSIIGGRS